MNNRKGKIIIPQALYDEYYFLHITEIFKYVKVLSIQPWFGVQHQSVMEIIGISKHFQEIKEGEVLPEYSVSIEKLNPDSKEEPIWKVTFQPDYATPKPIIVETPKPKLWPEAKRVIGPTITWATKKGNVPLMRNPPPAPEHIRIPTTINKAKVAEEELLEMIKVFKAFGGKENTPGAWQELEELTKNMQILVMEYNLQDLYNQHFPNAKLPTEKLVLQSKYNREDIMKSWEAYSGPTRTKIGTTFRDFLLNETVITRQD